MLGWAMITRIAGLHSKQDPQEVVNPDAFTLWEQTLVAIGGAAVVNRLAHFCLEKRGARVTAASRQIARKRYSYSG